MVGEYGRQAGLGLKFLFPLASDSSPAKLDFHMEVVQFHFDDCMIRGLFAA